VVRFTMPDIDPSDRQANAVPRSVMTRARARASDALVRRVHRQVLPGTDRIRVEADTAAKAGM